MTGPVVHPASVGRLVPPCAFYPTDRIILTPGTPDVNASDPANRYDRRVPVCRPIPRKGEACLDPTRRRPFATSNAVEGLGMTRGGHSGMCRIDSCERGARVALVQARTGPVGAAAMRGAGLGPTEVALRSGSDADEVVELVSVGAAAMDLFGQATEQGHVIQARGRLLDAYASHAGEPAGDIDDVDGAATGTFDLATMCRLHIPSHPFRTGTSPVRPAAARSRSRRWRSERAMETSR